MKSENARRIAEQVFTALVRDPAAQVAIHLTGEDGGTLTLNCPKPDQPVIFDPRGLIPIPAPKN